MAQFCVVTSLDLLDLRTLSPLGLMDLGTAWPCIFSGSASGEFFMLRSWFFGFVMLLPLCAAEESVWISVDRKEAIAIQNALQQDYGVAVQWSAFLDQQIAIGQISRADLQVLSTFMHERYNRCSGFFQHRSFEDAFEAGEKLRQAQIQAQKVRLGSPYTIDNPTGVAMLEPLIEAQSILDFITTFSSYEDRYYTSQTGVDSATWLRDHWAQLTETRDDVEVSLFRHVDFAQPSVRARFVGSTNPEEVVVLGGHLDSISFSGGAPGADDNASGIGCLTEVIRAMVASNFKPQKTVEFFGYAGEEAGLLGSRDIAGSYNQTNVNVIAALQLDMTNFNGSASDIWFLTDFTDPGLTSFVESLVDIYLTDLTRGQTRCGYGCSDHASWFREGFASVMPFEARFGDHNGAIHSPSDTLARSGNSADHAMKFARLAATYVAEVAKGGIFEVPPQVNVAVDMRTLVTLLNSYGECGADCPTDLDDNAVVNEDDFALLRQEWMETMCLGFGVGEPCGLQ